MAGEGNTEVIRADVVIVGGRVAGAASAILLAQRGHRVVVLDRDSTTRPALSTHVFGDWEAFDRLGMTETLVEAGAPRITRFRTELDGAGLDGELLVTPYVLCLRRERLDHLLAARARSFATVQWLSDTAAHGVLEERGRVLGVRASQAGRSLTLLAPAVVGADGRRSLVARAVCAGKTLSCAPRRCAYYAYFAGVAPQPIPTFEYLWCGSDLVLVAPCDGELHCVCVMPPQEDFHRWRRDAPEMLERRLTHAGTLTARLRDARRVGRVRGSGTLSSYLRTGAGPGWALVGDAAAAVHPCIGAGIDHAVRCAGALADALDGVLSGQASWERAAAEYGRARDEIVTPTLELAVELAARRELASDQRALFGLVVTLPGLGYDVAARTADVVSLISGPERRRRLEALLGLGVNGTGQSAVPEPAIP